PHEVAVRAFVAMHGDVAAERDRDQERLTGPDGARPALDEGRREERLEAIHGAGERDLHALGDREHGAPTVAAEGAAGDRDLRGSLVARLEAGDPARLAALTDDPDVAVDDGGAEGLAAGQDPIGAGVLRLE